VASAPGGIGFPQLVQAPRVNVVAFSAAMNIPNDGSVNVRLAYMFSVSFSLLVSLLLQFNALIFVG
jgi:hypothetical protein